MMHAIVGLLVNISLLTKFEVPSFTYSKDMIVIPKVGHVTLTTPIWELSSLGKFG